MAARSVKDVIAGGKLKTFIDRRLIKALAHPLREHCLAVFNERVASTSDIGREIDLDVPAFYHHVEVLEELGCVERVGEPATTRCEGALFSSQVDPVDRRQQLVEGPCERQV